MEDYTNFEITGIIPDRQICSTNKLWMQMRHNKFIFRQWQSGIESKKKTCFSLSLSSSKINDFWSQFRNSRRKFSRVFWYQCRRYVNNFHRSVTFNVTLSPVCTKLYSWLMFVQAYLFVHLLLCTLFRRFFFAFFLSQIYVTVVSRFRVGKFQSDRWTIYTSLVNRNFTIVEFQR